MTYSSIRTRCWPISAGVVLMLMAGCGGGGSAGSSPVPPPISPPPPVVSPPPAPQNQAPAISGTPGTTARIGASYVFQPSASDPDGDPLTFQIVGRPAWATFEAASGRLAGTPTAADVGTTKGIIVSVSDGKSTATLAPFDLTVPAAVVASATLTWQPPVLNEDGSALTNLAGYVIRYGQNPSSLSQRIDVGNPGLTTYVVDGLGEGTWYFSLSSVTTAGIESRPSNPVWFVVK